MIKHVQLAWSLSLRDFQSKYQGTLLGFLWMVVLPLLMLATYSMVFGVIFKSRWMGQGDTATFVTTLFCGLVLYSLFSDSMVRSVTAIRSQPNFVKKVVFPLEILPLVVLGSTLLNALIGFSILVLMTLLVQGGVSPTALLFPVVILPMIIFLVGICWFLASLGVYFPDLQHIVTFLSSLLLFLSPVFFPVEAAPEIVQTILLFNPITVPIEEFRRVLLTGDLPRWGCLAVYWCVSCTVAFLGYRFFQITRDGFGDVL